MESLFRVLAGPYRGAEEADRNGAGERPLRARQGIWALVYLTWANGLPLPRGHQGCAVSKQYFRTFCLKFSAKMLSLTLSFSVVF